MMKKILTLVTSISLAYTLSATAQTSSSLCSFPGATSSNTVFNFDTGQLHLPWVEIFSNGAVIATYEVCMQTKTGPFDISFEVTNYQNAVASRILKRVRDHGSLTCGGRTDLPGFGFLCPPQWPQLWI